MEVLMFFETMLCLYVCDFDFTSLYPSIMRALNVARMTLKFVPISINGNNDRTGLERYFSNMVNVKENAVNLCSEFHGLPSYSEMDEIFKNMNK